MADDLNWLSAREMARRFARGELSPVDVLEATLAQLRKVDPVLNAVCLLDEPLGRRMAKESAERWRSGAPLGPLDGVPIAIKDSRACRRLAVSLRLACDGSDTERGGYARRRPTA